MSPGRDSPGRGSCSSAKGPVSRILSCAVIPLGAALPRTLISDLPGGFGNCSSRLAASGRCAAPPGSFAVLPSLFGLAPCGVYPAPAFTGRAVRSYRTFSPLPRRWSFRNRKRSRQAGPTRVLRFQGGPPRFRRTGRGSRGGIFSVALAVRGPSSPRPGRYPAHCPAEFGLSSPGDSVSQAPGSDRPVLLPVPSLPRNRSHTSSALLCSLHRSLYNQDSHDPVPLSRPRPLRRSPAPPGRDRRPPPPGPRRKRPPPPRAPPRPHPRPQRQPFQHLSLRRTPRQPRRHPPRNQPRRRRHLPRPRPTRRLPHLRPPQPPQPQQRQPLRPCRLRPPHGRSPHPPLRCLRRRCRAHLRPHRRLVPSGRQPFGESCATHGQGPPARANARSAPSAFTSPAASPPTDSPSTSPPIFATSRSSIPAASPIAPSPA